MVLAKHSPYLFYLVSVTNESPNLRYLAGKDVETWMGSKRSMSDEAIK
jgi:hypothetical protein